LFKSKNYLLNDNSFILKEDFIYVNPRSKQISLIYLPLEMECKITQEFKSFLVNLLINTVNIDTEDNYVQLLLNQIKSDHFSLAEFRKQLTTTTSINCTSLSSEMGPESVFIKENEEEHLNLVEIPDEGLSKNKIQKTVLAISAIAFVIYVILSNLPIQFRALLTRPDKATAIVLALGCASLLAVIAVLMMLTKKNRAPNLSPIGTDEKETEKAAVLTDGEGNSETTLLADCSTETSLLSNCHFPHLEPVNGKERIVINKNEFFLGRQKGISDHVILNKNIGRLHAQISYSDSKYYIADMDSVNGTFINGSRILSNKQYILNHNDKITMANLEYLFICPQP